MPPPPASSPFENSHTILPPLRDTVVATGPSRNEVRVVDLAAGMDIATLHSPASVLVLANFIPNSLDLVTADEAGHLYRWRIRKTIKDLREAAEPALPRDWTEAEERRFGLR